MPPILVGFAVLGGILILVAVLPHLEVQLPRRYRDIVYVRLRRNGARIDVWRGKPVHLAHEAEFEWTAEERRAFDGEGIPLDAGAATTAIRRRLRPMHRRFPFGPIIVLHAIDKAMGGLSEQDRRILNRVGDALGNQVLVGDLPNAFPERAFWELRAHGLGPWGES
ncbi:hypothetical protein [Minwuia sp.]|uniref:hypothetical protein n=1 Tax=Minwuia sp. TaxID=2493630 RepID=UPI003A8F35D7